MTVHYTPLDFFILHIHAYSESLYNYFVMFYTRSCSPWTLGGSWIRQLFVWVSMQAYPTSLCYRSLHVFFFFFWAIFVLHQDTTFLTRKYKRFYILIKWIIFLTHFYITGKFLTSVCGTVHGQKQQQQQVWAVQQQQ